MLYTYPYTRNYQRTLFTTSVHLSLPTYTRDYQCTLITTNIHSWLSVYTYHYHHTLVTTSVHLSLPTYTRDYQCTLIIANSWLPVPSGVTIWYAETMRPMVRRWWHQPTDTVISYEKASSNVSIDHHVIRNVNEDGWRRPAAMFADVQRCMKWCQSAARGRSCKEFSHATDRSITSVSNIEKMNVLSRPAKDAPRVSTCERCSACGHINLWDQPI